MGYVTSYFNWLQKDCPTGEVEKYPQLDDHGQTTLEGVYVSGDLTGIPLLTMAANSGAQLVRKFSYDGVFEDKSDDYDIIIIGGGPAGISAAVECQKRKLNYLVVEGSRLFNTIENFPKAKSIIATPTNDKYISELKITDGVKESLLEDLKSSIHKKNLNIKTGLRVEQISRKNGLLEVKTKDELFIGKRVILAIGKSGDARKLKVPGEELGKVKNRLFDPADHYNQNILVVGGGDNALETANALAAQGNTVTISYRKRPFRGQNKKTWRK